MKTLQLDMIKKRLASLVLCAFAIIAISGCASDYNRYATTSADMAKVTESTKAARFDALRNLGCNTMKLYHQGVHVGTETKCDPEAAKFAAFALAVSGMTTAQEQVAKIEAPYTLGQAIRDVGGLVVPLANVGAQIYGIKQNTAVAITQSNNSAAVAMNTNNTMAGIATGGFNAAANIAAGGFTAATTLGNRPTTVVNGGGNAVNGASVSTTTTNTTTNTNNCPAGNGGNGTGAPSGAGAPANGTTGPAGGTSGNGGTGGGAAGGAVNCTAGK